MKFAMPAISNAMASAWMWATLSLFQQAPSEVGVIEERVIDTVTGDGIRGARFEIGCMEVTTPGTRCEHTQR